LIFSQSLEFKSRREHLILEDVRTHILGIDGPVHVNDLHVWTFSSGLHGLIAQINVQDWLASHCSVL